MATWYVDLENGLDGVAVVDSSSSPKSVTAGSVVVSGGYNGDTATKKFGAASGKFSGSASIAADNGLAIQYNSAFNMGTGDFTIEFWINPINTSNPFASVVGNNSFSWSTGGIGGAVAMYYGATAVTGVAPSAVTNRAGKVGLTSNYNNVAADYNSTSALSAGTWYHVAFSKVSNSMYVFVNGVLEATYADTRPWDFSYNGQTCIGWDGWDGAQSRLAAYIDELRITKGVGRYTASFTPQTAAFDDTDPYWANVSLLLHFDEYEASPATRGSSFASRLKSINSASTKMATGDTLRIMASPTETLVGNATWTSNSKTVTLASSVTANISTCETAWTAATSVTTNTSAARKEGSLCCLSSVAAAFTTGKISHTGTGLLDLSGYQQVSFWINITSSYNAGIFSLRLCSDTSGNVTVHTIPVPAVIASNTWQSVTVDLNAPLSSSIQSVALYAEVDPGTVAVFLDNIIACKAASAADALTLNSLIGKVWNRSWTASTAYALNDIRRPGQPNRTGFVYKVTTAGTTGSTEPAWPQELGLTVVDGTVTWTCFDLEDTWYPISGINGTAVTLDAHGASVPATSYGAYQGATETVATYKREPARYGSTSGGSLVSTFVSGSPGNYTTYSGGWNRTDMSTQDGETWASGTNCSSNFLVFTNSYNWLQFVNLNATRMNSGFRTAAPVTYQVFAFKNCHGTGNNTAFDLGAGRHILQNVVASSNGNGVNCYGAYSFDASQLTTNGSTNSTGFQFGAMRVRVTNMVAKGNSQALYGYNVNVRTSGDAVFSNLRTANNGTVMALGDVNRGVGFINPTYAEATPFSGVNYDAFVWNQKYQGTANAHYIYTNSGTIQTVTDVRHAASGVAWRFNVNGTTFRGYAEENAVRVSVAKIACQAGVTRNVTIWTRRAATNVHGKLHLHGGQIAGVPKDIEVLCDPAINTWVQSAALTFTPTESGVVEIEFLVWDTTSSGQNYWIDDLTVT